MNELPFCVFTLSHSFRTAVVITRIFGLVIKGNKTDGLAPYADMLNHKVPKETSWTFDDNRYGLIITSLKVISLLFFSRFFSFIFSPSFSLSLSRARDSLPS